MAEDTDNGRDSLETYLLLVLADSALPTGGFVASSGLESSVQHGFVSSSSSSPFGLLSFVRESLSSYARLNLPFLDRAHRTVQNYHLRSSSSSSSSSSATTTTAILQDTVESLLEIDGELESMMLNHVARRASKAQGIALLTLYSRAFAEVHVPSSSSLPPANGHTIPDPAQHATATVMTDLIDALKLASRGKGKGKGEGAVGAAARMQGHLPVCFAVLTAALGLPLDRTQHLHLFLQARSILSSAVRLNLLGPYAAQRLLLSDVRPLVESVLEDCRQRADDYNDDEGGFGHGPATTWPLGEILQARHDALHSRIFNS